VQGGLYLWCPLLDPSLEATALQREAARAGVALVAGVPFYADGDGEHHVRLCFAGAPPEELDRGVARLARVFVGAGADGRHAGPRRTPGRAAAQARPLV